LDAINFWKAIRAATDYKITDAADIAGQRGKIERRITEASARLSAIEKERGKIRDVKEKANFYWGTSRENAGQMTRLKLAAAKEIVDEYGITGMSDFLKLDERLKILDDEAAEVKEKISADRAADRGLAKLAELYEQVRSGSYIAP
jgi:hypothetical protein